VAEQAALDVCEWTILAAVWLVEEQVAVSARSERFNRTTRWQTLVARSVEAKVAAHACELSRKILMHVWHVAERVVASVWRRGLDSIPPHRPTPACRVVATVAACARNRLLVWTQVAPSVGEEVVANASDWRWMILMHAWPAVEQVVASVWRREQGQPGTSKVYALHIRTYFSTVVSRSVVDLSSIDSVFSFFFRG